MCVVTPKSAECYFTTNPPFRTLTTAALLDNVWVESRTFRPSQMLIFSGRLRESNRRESLQRPKVVAVVYDFPTAFGFRFYLSLRGSPGGGGTRYVPGWGGAARPLIP